MSSEGDVEYGNVVAGIFSMANVPVLCERKYTNSIRCNLLSCLTDRSPNGYWGNCCTFVFTKNKTLSIQWDHASQIKKKIQQTMKVGADVVYALMPYYSGAKQLKIEVNLMEPTSLDKASAFVRESALFHLRIGYDHRMSLSR